MKHNRERVLQSNPSSIRLALECSSAPSTARRRLGTLSTERSMSRRPRVGTLWLVLLEKLGGIWRLLACLAGA
jgi:hypothetical protein